MCVHPTAMSHQPANGQHTPSKQKPSDNKSLATVEPRTKTSYIVTPTDRKGWKKRKNDRRGDKRIGEEDKGWKRRRKGGRGG